MAENTQLPFPDTSDSPEPTKIIQQKNTFVRWEKR